MPENSTFEPDGRAVPFVEEGSASGPTLVLIPGPGLEGDGLGTIAHILAEEEFHVFRVGTRTTSDGSLPSTEERVEDLLAVMDHVGLDHAWIGGHGAGSIVARAFALAHEDRANGILLLGVEESDVPLAPTLPVLILQGSADDVTPPSNGGELQQAAPDRVTLVNIDGAGNLFPMTHPVETTMVIEDYLDWD